MPSQKTKDSAHSRKSSSLEEIKKRFEHNYLYIIFEGTEVSENNEVFEKTNLFLRSVKGVIEKRFYPNKKEGKLYLIVKLDLKHSDSILDELYSIEISKKFSFYIYGSRLKD